MAIQSLNDEWLPAPGPWTSPQAETPGRGSRGRILTEDYSEISVYRVSAGVAGIFLRPTALITKKMTASGPLQVSWRSRTESPQACCCGSPASARSAGKRSGFTARWPPSPPVRCWAAHQSTASSPILSFDLPRRRARANISQTRMTPSPGLNPSEACPAAELAGSFQRTISRAAAAKWSGY